MFNICDFESEMVGTSGLLATELGLQPRLYLSDSFKFKKIIST